MFQCQECGKKFRTVKAAEKASLDGCPRCGSTDVDLERTDVQRWTDERQYQNESGEIERF